MGDSGGESGDSGRSARGRREKDADFVQQVEKMTGQLRAVASLVTRDYRDDLTDRAQELLERGDVEYDDQEPLDGPAWMPLRKRLVTAHRRFERHCRTHGVSVARLGSSASEDTEASRRDDPDPPQGTGQTAGNGLQPPTSETPRGGGFIPPEFSQ